MTTRSNQSWPIACARHISVSWRYAPVTSPQIEIAATSTASVHATSARVFDECTIDTRATRMPPRPDGNSRARTPARGLNVARDPGMRILLVYASHFGQTFAIASRIAQRLRDIGHHVELANADAGIRMLPPPDDYDAVILGSRIEYQHHDRKLVDYIRVYRDALTRMPTGFFSVSMAAATPSPDGDPAHYLAGLFEGTGWHPTEATAFAGALAYRRYGWFTRQLMRA